jgi:predicted RNA-binding Zn ribbon-like protein
MDYSWFVTIQVRLMVMSKQRQAPGELERVRRFVNTRQVGRVTDRLSDPSALAAWLEQEGLAPAATRATRADLARAVALREALRAILLAHNAGPGPGPGPGPGRAAADAALADARRALDEAAARARLRVRFGDDGSALLAPEAGGVSGALGRLVATVHDSIAQGTWTRLKVCRDPECEWAFYDHTKNRSGAWCSMEGCGNRAKARAFRERRAAVGGERRAAASG